ncbi:hypothetical protein CC80DRAFT_175925 [Byssothecium circinans]|uniref:Uncharacterized protein n=1 Tax=Byssothecium circinans TaxID=147558 RepID=A0A6A5TUB9_9PLEO|nr:hypothetical protein CC80DRAFT_175925 [Byssothecium circinans]
MIFRGMRMWHSGLSFTSALVLVVADLRRAAGLLMGSARKSEEVSEFVERMLSRVGLGLGVLMKLLIGKVPAGGRSSGHVTHMIERLYTRKRH